MSDQFQQMTALRANYTRLTQDFRSISERVDYLTVASARGDPRFTKQEYAKPDFDSAAFDDEWRRRGKRVPTLEEVFG